MKNLMNTIITSVALLVSLPVIGQTLPNDFTLNELSTYVNKPIDCQSIACSSLSQMQLEKVNWQTRELTFSFIIQSRTLSTIQLPIDLTGLSVKALRLNGKDWVSATKSGQQLSVVGPEGQHALELTLGFSSDLIAIEIFGMPKNFLNQDANSTAKIGNRSGNHVLTITNKSENVTPKEQVNTANLLDTLPKKPLFVVSHNLYLERTWKLRTTVYPVSGSVVTHPVAIEVPLLSGEKILNEGYVVENGKLHLMATNAPISWDSIIPVQSSLKINASSENLLEQFNVYAKKEWIYSFEGNNPVSQSTPSGYKSSSQWLLWPQDKLVMQFTHPASLPGATSAVNNYKLMVNSTTNPITYKFNFDYTTSLGGRSYIGLPKDFTVDVVQVNGKLIPSSMENHKIALDLLGNKNHVEIILKSSAPLNGLIKFPELEFDTTVVNKEYTLNTNNKWLLFAGGANIQPAVLLWGILVSLILFSVILAKLPLTPYGTLTWVLLFLGLSQAGLIGCAIIVGTLLLCGAKKIFLSKGYIENRGVYNGFQVILMVLTAFSIVMVLITLKHGLLNNPEVFISGLNSYQGSLYWYAENNTVSSPWAFFLPVWVYRILMFAWAMWFAAKSINMLKWIWENLNEGTLWIKPAAKEELVEIDDNNIEIAKNNTEI